jgi:hypothetical protein
VNKIFFVALILLLPFQIQGMSTQLSFSRVSTMSLTNFISTVSGFESLLTGKNEKGKSLLRVVAARGSVSKVRHLLNLKDYNIDSCDREGLVSFVTKKEKDTIELCQKLTLRNILKILNSDRRFSLLNQEQAHCDKQEAAVNALLSLGRIGIANSTKALCGNDFSAGTSANTITLAQLSQRVKAKTRKSKKTKNPFFERAGASKISCVEGFRDKNN